MIGSFIGSPIGGVLGNSGVNATASITLDDATLSATGTIALTGQASITLDDATLTATGALAIVGTETAILDDCVIAAFATFKYDNITGLRTNSKFITGQMSNFTNITTPRVNNPQITA